MSIGSSIKRLIHALAVKTVNVTESSPAHRALVTSSLDSRVQETQQVKPSDDHASFLLKQIRNKAAVTMVHGRGGTGKTTLIRAFAKEGLKHAIVAPTGIAALRAGGQTIHKFFGIPPRIVNLADIAPKQKLTSILSRLDVLIIDEISMVRADLLDVIDKTLKVNLGNAEPFGGLPVILVGDFLQLAPVVTKADANILAHLGYEHPYAFSAKCLSNVRLDWLELEKVYRQTDVEFIELLAKIRTGQDVEATVELLNLRCYRPHRTTAKPIILSSRTDVADEHNRLGLAALRGDILTYKGILRNNFQILKDKLPAPEMLVLKLGARILLVKNDTELRWVNGSLGTVSKLSKDGILVTLDADRKQYEVKRVEWESIEYRYDPLLQRVNPDVVGTYTQFPIQHAWAITIHKSQGLTLADVRVDLGEGAFSVGQAYVALSRCTSINGLSLEQPLRVSDVKANLLIVESLERRMKEAQSGMARPTRAVR